MEAGNFNNSFARMLFTVRKSLDMQSDEDVAQEQREEQQVKLPQIGSTGRISEEHHSSEPLRQRPIFTLQTLSVPTNSRGKYPSTLAAKCSTPFSR